MMRDEVGRKIETAVTKTVIEVDAIRVACTKNMIELNSTRERGDKPVLYIKSTNRNGGEIEIIFMGKPRIEKLSYYTTHPDTWTSWGEIILTKQQVDKIKEYIKNN